VATYIEGRVLLQEPHGQRRHRRTADRTQSSDNDHDEGKDQEAVTLVGRHEIATEDNGVQDAREPGHGPTDDEDKG